MSGDNKKMEVDVSLGAVPDDGVLADDEERITDKESPAKNNKPAINVNKSDENSPPSEAGLRPRADSFNSDVNGRKKKHRRGKHKGGRRHWKPYSKMTWDEKKALEDRETRRACKKREDRFASGQPMAPYNTTQFLMEQHQPSDVNLGDNNKPRLNKSETGGEGSGSASGSSGDEYYSSPDDEEIFLEKEFTEAYENFHAERLQTMSKDELVREYLELESKVELMEKRTKEKVQNLVNGQGTVQTATDEDNSENKQDSTLSNNDKLSNSPGKHPVSDETNVKLLQEEIKRLRQDNEKLRQENELLRRPGSKPGAEGEP